jgi:hypothetical protein
MFRRIRSCLTYANVMATIAVFIAVGGSSYAVAKIGSSQIADNSIRSRDIKNNDVQGIDIRDGTIRTRDVADRSLLANDFAAGQLPAGPLGPQGPQGTSGQDATAPAGAVMFFNLASCPTGWSELDAARGRYLVGVPSGGTLGGASGTPLTNQENRPVGQHSHSATDSGHSHSIRAVSDSSTAGSDFGLLYGGRTVSSFAYGTTSGQSSVTTANAGSVAGTNAPYLQLRVCQKS